MTVDWRRFEPSWVELGAIALAFLFALHSWRMSNANHALALRVYNDSAALDTSRRLALSRKDSIRILGDSLTSATKLALQQRQDRDALDRALGQERKATVALSVTIDSLRAVSVPSVAPVVIDNQDTRRAAFHVEQGAYTAGVWVALPATGAGRLDSLKVTVQPAHVNLRIGCQDKNANGIRPARVTATGPVWQSIVIDHAEQEPEVCQSVTGQHTSWLRALFASFAPQIYVGVGASVNPVPILQGKPAEISPAVQVGVSLFHVPLRIPWP